MRFIHTFQRFVFVGMLVAGAGLSLFQQNVSAQCDPDGYGYEPDKCVTGFIDVDYSPYAEAINYVREEGIVKGYEDGTFRPRQAINRAEFAKIMVESVLGGPSSTTSCFSDVPEAHWYAVYACTLKEQDIVAGYPDGTFRPGNLVNVAEAAKILANLFDLQVREVSGTEAWFVPYIETFAREGVLLGSFTDAGDFLTRSEMAELILRLQKSQTNKPSLTTCDLVAETCSGYRELSDVGTHPHSESIEFLLRRGLVSGYEDGTYRPWAPVNRAEMLKLLLEAKHGKGSTNTLLGSCFTDVNAEWYAPYICTAKNDAIVKGYPDGSFNPGQVVNRVEALKMALQIYGVNIRQATSGEDWFVPYVEFAHNNNLFSRFSYLPAAHLNRGDAAFLIQRLLADQAGLIPFRGVRDSRSAGCGKAAPGVPPTSSFISGVQQSYITDVPASYDSNEPIALTFAWHGRTNSNSTVRTYYKVYEASNGGTIMVYPAGIGPWNLNRDVAIFDQLLAEFSENYCIDLDRVYIVGHSLGSWFTNSLACIRGDIIRASGSLGGSTTWNDCSGPVAAITMHNPDDRLAPFSGGVQARDLHLQQNQCSDVNVPYSSPDKANCVEYTQCAPDQPVVWCPHTEDYSFGYYYPHGWPKWTGSEIWKFFESLD